MQINRLFEIIYLLLERKMMTASNLAAHFEVSTRTIYRDVETLSQSGIPIYTSKGMGGGIHLAQSFVLNKSVLTPEEQKSILSSLQSMNALRVDGAQTALEKLSALFGGKHMDWIEIDFSSWNTISPISDYFILLKKSIFSQTLVSFQYSGVDGCCQTRTVEPLKLVFKWSDWYLLAWCRLRDAFRCFKLTRMEALCASDEHFAQRHESMQVSPNAMAVQPMIHVTAHIAANMEYRVLDEFTGAQRTQNSDGSYVVEIEMPDGEWLYQYLLAYGANLRVLSPPSVQKQLLSRLIAAAAQYS